MQEYYAARVACSSLNYGRYKLFDIDAHMLQDRMLLEWLQ